MGAGGSVPTDPAELMSLVEEMLGSKLLKGEEEIETKSAFEGKRAVALYFSAHWCPPCRGFTPKLAEMYTANLAEKGMEVVFVSSDRDEGSFKDYFKDMPWLALPFGERGLKEKLSAKFKVEGIPTMIIINAETGAVITKDGRAAVMKDPTGEKFPWIPPTFAEALGESFLSGDGSVGKEAIEGKHLGLYFSAHWCPPCRSFTPSLAKWYAGIKPEVKDKFEIIFCSGDQDEDGMKSYYKEQCDAGGDWLCLPWASKDSLDGLFEVKGIPTFIIVSPDGKVINQSGRGLVPSATPAEFPWAPPKIGDLESPDGINQTPSMCLMLEACDDETTKRIMDAVTPIAEEFSGKDGGDPELLFFAAKSQGGVSSQIRGMCGVEGVGTVSKKEESAIEGPKLVRTITSDTPTLILMDIPDNGGYYVGRMAKALDGSGVRQMIEDWKAKKLTRQQLS